MAGQMTLMNEMRDIASIAADMASTDTSVRVRGAIDFLRSRHGATRSCSRTRPRVPRVST